MMTREGAMAYGKKIGCKYYVRNSNGGLLGGFVRKEDAERCKAKWEKELESDPWNKDIKVYIEEKE